MNRLWYDKPSSVWNEALPLGNGRLGAMVFGGTVFDRISLNEDSLWYGGFRDRVNPDAKTYLPRIRELLREEKISEAQALAVAALTACPDTERHYEPLGDLVLFDEAGASGRYIQTLPNLTNFDMSRLEMPCEDYSRSLDMMEGIHRVSYVSKGVRHER